MIYLLNAIGLSPGGSSTVHIYTQTIHRTTQNKQYIEQHNNLGQCGPCPVLVSYTLALALQLRKNIQDHMRFYCFFHILLVLLCIIVYMVVCCVCFCLILYIMFSYCYVYALLLLCIFRSRYCVSLCCSAYCLCLNV